MGLEVVVVVVVVVVVGGNIEASGPMVDEGEFLPPSPLVGLTDLR